MKRYTEDQIVEATERRDIITSMLDSIDYLKQDAKDAGVVQILDMLEDIRDELMWEAEELDTIMDAGARQQTEDERREYRLAVI